MVVLTDGKLQKPEKPKYDFLLIYLDKNLASKNNFECDG
jgi:hypothetical protein